MKCSKLLLPRQMMEVSLHAQELGHLETMNVVLMSWIAFICLKVRCSWTCRDILNCSPQLGGGL